MVVANDSKSSSFQGPASRRQTSWRGSAGHLAESIPAKVTPRNRKGKTVNAKSFPIARAVGKLPNRFRQV